MNNNVTVLERAFQLAKSGGYATVPDIKKRLIEEGFSIAQVTGRTLSKQLNALIQAARAESPVVEGPPAEAPEGSSQQP